MSEQSKHSPKPKAPSLLHRIKSGIKKIVGLEMNKGMANCASGRSIAGMLSLGASGCGIDPGCRSFLMIKAGHPLVESARC